MVRVTPTCRYGHGPLERQDGEWALSQVQRVAGEDTGGWSTGVRFVASLYRCATCGYLELMDDEEANT